MPAAKEVVSLQCGSYSNFIGQHFWNLQGASFAQDSTPSSDRELNPDVLYREGENLSKQSTFTPRLLLFDLKGTWNTLRSSGGELYETDAANSRTEQHAFEVIKTDDHVPNEYCEDFRKQNESFLKHGFAETEKKTYDFESSVSTWSDFRCVNYHPRSMNVLQDYKANADEDCFTSYLVGKEAWKDGEDGYVDNLRRFVEECNNMQGFHLTFDMDNGFSGFASTLLDHISDEYRTKTVFAFPVLPGARRNWNQAMHGSYYGMNCAHSLARLWDTNLSILINPMSTVCEYGKNAGERKFQSMNPSDSWYHTSAILATALDAVSSAYRTSSGYLMHELQSKICLYQQRATSVSLSLPFLRRPEESLYSTLLNADDSPYHSKSTTLAPYCKFPKEIGSNTVDAIYSVVRGIPIKQQRITEAEAHSNRLPHFFSEMSGQEILEQHVNERIPGCQIIPQILHTPCYTKAPFPSTIFSQHIQRDGTLNLNAKRGEHQVDSVALQAFLHAAGSSGVLLKKTAQNIPRSVFFSNLAHDRDEAKETCEILLNASENYPACPSDEVFEDDDSS